MNNGMKGGLGPTSGSLYTVRVPEKESTRRVRSLGKEDAAPKDRRDHQNDTWCDHEAPGHPAQPTLPAPSASKDPGHEFWA